MKTASLFVSVFLLLLSEPATAQKKKSGELPESRRIELQEAFINAHKECALGNYERSAELLEKCLEIDPQNTAAMHKLSEVYRLRKSYKKALELAEKACELEEGNKWYLLQKAGLQRETKDYEEAAKTYAQVASLEKENPDHYYNAANMFLAANKPEQALKIIDKLEKETGLLEEISFQKQRIYLGMKKPGKAIDELNRLIAAYPAETRYKLALADLYMNEKQEEKAFAVYQQILKTEPGNGQAHLGLADYYQARGERDKTFAELKMAFADAGVDIKSKMSILVAYFTVIRNNKSLKEEAFTLAEILAETHAHEAAAHAVYGDLLVNDLQYKDARSQFLLAVQLEPGRFNVWQQLIFCDAELNDYSSMAEHCLSALELFPNAPELYLYSVIAHAQTKQYEKVVEAAKGGLELGTADEATQIQLLANMGDAYHFLKRYASSDSAYEEALEMDENNSYVLNNYAYFLSLRKEKLDRAEKMSAKTISKEPESATYLDTYGWILYQQKKYEAAARQLEKAATSDKKSAEVQEHYGDVLFRLGRIDEALQYWKKAKELGSSNSLLDKKISEKKLYE